jgi:hypothetical protein
MNRYTVETDLPFDKVAAALEGRKPKVLILTDGSSQVTNVTVGGVTTRQGMNHYQIRGLMALLVFLGILIGKFVF